MRQNNNLPVWIITNGWREIFTRIFEDEELQLNVNPDWLVNPATNRRLKLDILYPELGVAVRFEGLQGKQRRSRLSLEEEAQMRVRHDARIDMCRSHGIHLIVVQVATDEPKTVFHNIDTALSRAGQGFRAASRLKKLKDLRATAASLARKVNTLADLKLYAELWEDRQYQVPEPAAQRPVTSTKISYTAGMEVEHPAFGPGVVIEISSSDGDTLITVDFVTAGQKMLAASLVADKLLPR